jgi:ATP-dependent Clp protease protease subunit
MFVNKIKYNMTQEERFYTDFQGYAKSMGISSLNQHYVGQQIKSSLTPYILEERSMNATAIDIFSRMMFDRIIFLAGEVNDTMGMYTIAQLQYLDSIDSSDITFQINSPGGSVSSGLAIIDTMNYISCDIRTINLQLAASMGSLLLGAGTKGKRCILPNAKTMIHQSSGGFGGEFAAAEIQFKEWIKINDKIFEMLGEYTNKTAEQVKKDAVRDLWLDANEAIEYKIADEIIIKKKK